MAEWLVIFLLPLAAYSGWWVAMRHDARQMRQDRSHTAYFEGLSYLLDDQTDKAVDVFVAITEFDQQTIENQLTLGRLFRRRGEVDRALHLHKQLEQQAKPGSTQLYDIMFELGEDYRCAGMFAQAQEVYEQLLDLRPRKPLLKAMKALYERTGNWSAASAIAERWQNSGYGEQHTTLANYDCELAEAARQKGDTAAAYGHLHDALQRDRQCARANVLMGSYCLEDGQYIQALYAFQSLAQQSPAQLPDVLPLMTQAYCALSREEEYQDWLWHIAGNSQQVRLVIAAADALQQIGRQEMAAKLLAQALASSDSPLLIWSCLQHGVDIATRSQEIMAAIKPQTIYQCGCCGFRQQKQCWHCPACFAWNSFVAVLSLKVEQS